MLLKCLCHCNVQARVEAAGGQILFWNGVRVMGVLAVSRAIGDHCLRPFVIAQPEVGCTAMTLVPALASSLAVESLPGTNELVQLEAAAVYYVVGSASSALSWKEGSSVCEEFSLKAIAFLCR